jgi:ceramide glucosyltransferase
MKWQALVLASMALELLLLAAFLSHSRHHVRQSFPGRERYAGPPDPGAPAGTPKAAIIVPLTGNSPAMTACLQSLLRLDYPNYETVFVTRDQEDPATPLVRQVLALEGRGRHILSGPARACSQKNHNLLAGLAALDDSAQILVFCDSTHQAPPHFLKDLLRPIIQGEAVLTTGYHRIIPGDFRLATLGMLQTVLAIHVMLGLACIGHPWGGATAIRRSVFEDQGVSRLWSETVVDDMSLGAHLLKDGIRVKSVPTAILATPLGGATTSAWADWITRQLLYLKYCTPVTWIVGALVVYLLGGPVILAGLVGLGYIFGLISGNLAGLGLGFLVLLTGLGVWFRTLVPQRIPLGPWLLAFYATLLLVPWCYLRSCFTDTISWRGISYRVTWGGRVREIISGR